MEIFKFKRIGKSKVSSIIARNAKIFAFLKQILETNTKHYKSDFKFDVALIKRATNNKSPIVWFSRDCGTVCHVQERIFQKGTYAQIEFCHFVSNANHVKAFELDNLHYDNEHQIVGDIYVLDYPRAVEYVNKVNKMFE